MDNEPTAFTSERGKINLKQLGYLLTILQNMHSWPPNPDLQDGATFDYIIAGAGSAGSVLANRLSENGLRRVLLIEAGGEPGLLNVVPGAVTLLPGTKSDYNFRSVKDHNFGMGQIGGRLRIEQGKVLGGSSSVNFMLYVRGSKFDFDDWAKEGGDIWSYNNILSYFKKSEGMLKKDLVKDTTNGAYHRGDGLLKVSQPKQEMIHSKKVRKMLQAFVDIGLKHNEDYNGKEQLGVSEAYFTHDDELRSSTAECFLRGADDRKNLTILTNAEVKKIDISNSTARGVFVEYGGELIRIFAKKEVIVSCGAINTAKLLIKSGIGPKEEVTKLGVPHLVDVPVGKNVIDHLYVPVLILGQKDKSTRKPVFELNKVPFPMIMGFTCEDSRGQAQIQYMISYIDEASLALRHLCRDFLNYRKSICDEWVEINSNREIYLTFVTLLHPKSKGNITVLSLDRDPEIRPGYFSHPDDMRQIIEGINVLGKLSQTRFFEETKAPTVFGNLNLTQCSHLKFTSNEYWACYSRVTCNTIHHWASSAPMGTVVDEKLKVRSLKSLRVVDASVFPSHTSGNTNAPVIMLAERAAQFIMEDNTD